MAFKDKLMDIVAIGGAILMKRDVLWFIGFSCIQTLIVLIQDMRWPR